MTICPGCGYDVNHPHSTGPRLAGCTFCGRLRPPEDLQDTVATVERIEHDHPKIVGEQGTEEQEGP